MSETVVELAKALIQCGNGADANTSVQQKLADFLKAELTEFEQIDAAGKQHACLFFGEGGPLLTFLGHSDVVSVGDQKLWSHPPFAAIEQEGVLYGRGAVDMRAANAAFAVALKEVWPEIKSRIQVAIAISGDEETTGEGAPALLALLQEKKKEPALCLVGEPSAASVTGDRIRIGRRGGLSGHFVFQGTQAHTAYVPAEQNVLHAAIEAASKLRAISWEDDAAPWPAVVFHIVYLSGGSGENNVVPGSAELKCNIRFGPGLNRDEIIRRCEDALADLAYPWKCTWSTGLEPYFTRERASVDLIKSAVAGVVAKEPSESVDGGSSDGRFFANAGIPTVELGTPAKTLHQVDEQVPCVELSRLLALYKAVLREFAGRQDA